jgi:3-hydroxymyristoyl/3-hydroxydecanoyl-(acyl carrier protein) dehydratase
MRERILLPSLVGFDPHPWLKVLEFTGDSLRAEMDGTSLVPLCEGHFPSEAIVPGSHVMAMAHDLAQWLECRSKQSELPLWRPKRSEFHRAVTPGSAISLVVQKMSQTEVQASIRNASDESMLAQICFVRDTEQNLHTRQILASTVLRSMGADCFHLEHRGPALLLASEMEVPLRDSAQRWFRTCEREWWTWPFSLDACAQGAVASTFELPSLNRGRILVVSYGVDALDLTPNQGTIDLAVECVDRSRSSFQMRVRALDSHEQKVKLDVIIGLVRARTP